MRTQQALSGGSKLEGPGELDERRVTQARVAFDSGAKVDEITILVCLHI